MNLHIVYTYIINVKLQRNYDSSILLSQVTTAAGNILITLRVRFLFLALFAHILVGWIMNKSKVKLMQYEHPSTRENCHIILV